MIEFVVLVILAILVFAVIGFLTLVTRLFRTKADSQSPQKSSRSQAASGPAQTSNAAFSLEQDLQATKRLIDHLFATSQIDEASYLQFRNFLEQKNLAVQPSVDIDLPDSSPAHSPTPSPAATVTTPFRPKSVDFEPAIRTEPILEIVTAEISVDDDASDISALPRRPNLDPWELPDPRPRVPRRSLAEVLSAFMQEKNMRWGELTSGILIVLSAVGLVVSLRDQLSDAIPYFSSILFMLITAAIIGSGIYTLKKWKLRNTSRGTLIIGLLLVPLNFVAACVLSGGENRRELTDVWLWGALAFGFGGFGTMTWFASRYLLRKGNLPLVINIVGCGVVTILINRVTKTTDTCLEILLLSLPLCASFLIGAGACNKRHWTKQYWSPRGTNRMFMHLGISTFATLTALSLLLIRSEDKSTSTVAVTPVLVLVCLIVSWFGSIIAAGRRPTGSNNLLVGSSLQVLGLILLGVCLFASLANPTVFVANCIVSALGLFLMAQQQKITFLLPAVWAVASGGVVASMNLAIGRFEFDQWASMDELRRGFVSGQSGLCLLVCGFVSSGMQGILSQHFGNTTKAATVRRTGLIVGGLISLTGCAIALIASMVNRENVFDAMTASGLLAVAGLGSTWAGVIANRRREPDGFASKVQLILPNLAAVLLLTGLFHALIWNLQISNWFNVATMRIGANWTTVFALHGLLLAIASAWKKPGSDRQVVLYWSEISAVLAVAGAVLLSAHQTGIATVLMIVATFSWWFISWTYARVESKSPLVPLGDGRPFVLSTAILVGVLISELITKWDWCPAIDHPRHWIIQIIGLSVWGILWTVLAEGLRRRPRYKWIVSSNPRVDQIVVFILVFCVGGLILASLSNGTVGELFKGVTVTTFSFGEERTWMIAALAAVSVATLLMTVQQPTPFKGVSIVVLWMAAWMFGAQQFESSNSTASAIRWMLPLGGLAGAILISRRRRLTPVWAMIRNRMGLRGPSSWSGKTTQRLINLALSIVVAVVLVLSTVTVSQVMINGAGALGGPDPGSWFGRMDKVVSFGVPLALVVAAFLVYAISERRPLLATTGSAVFQYIVVLALVLLFLSPHPKLASKWFVQILQSVSLGMTAYGFCWYLMRNRIQPLLLPKTTGFLDAQTVGWKWLSQIEIHTLINGLLITGLAVLVYGHYFLVPDQSGDWINSVGQPLGIIAWVSFAALAVVVWRPALAQRHSTMTQMSLLGWIGFVLVAMVAAIVDNNFQQRQVPAPWLAFKNIAAGTVVVAAVQVAWLWLSRQSSLKSNGSNSLPSTAPEIAGVRTKSTSLDGLEFYPLFPTIALGLTFAVRGAWDNVGDFWFFLTLIGLLVALQFVAGLLLRRTVLISAAAVVSLIGTGLVTWVDPGAWFPNDQPNWVNLSFVVGLALVLVNLLFYIYRRHSLHERITRSFLRLPNTMILLGSVWVMLGSIGQAICSSTPFVGDSSLGNPLGFVVLGLMLVLLLVSLWNDRRRFWVFGSYLSAIGVVMTIISILTPNSTTRAIWILFGCSATMAAWGIGWANRSSYVSIAKRLGAKRLASLQASMRRQLPVYNLVLMAILLLASTVAIWTTYERPLRYLAASTPLLMAIGIGGLSDQNRRRWLQLFALALVTLGILFVGWADLTPDRILDRSMISLLVRSLLVLAGAMFVYGSLIPRWSRPGDSWLKSLREMAAVTCAMAIACLGLLISQEAIQFQAEVGCGLTSAESAAVTFVGLGMVYGLISIAVRPERDPFALPLSGRQGYVYVAQLVVAGLVAHIYLSMPWLFQFGIKEYWPYIAMAICFGGVGLAHVLEKRRLTVLGQPLLTTAAVFPVVVAAGIFAIDSKSDGSLVMLTVGMAYLLISYLNRSILSGAASILFGNLALWMFYGNFPSFSFLAHPQLWLIPPAISVLIAGQFKRKSLTTAQLATIRYICVAVIYVSSTSEIFISGLGDSLWPPVVLALLSVAGVMAGILLQIRSFLYLGSLFLLMAMITMVAHAHKRFDHVWPWWAFGITLGMAILVLFGLFEKRKNEMKAVAGRLKEWDV